MTRPAERLEDVVLRMWDAGKSVEAISAAIGAKHENVMKVLSTFVGGGEQLEARQDAVRGSARLLSAIVASGGRFA